MTVSELIVDRNCSHRTQFTPTSVDSQEHARNTCLGSLSCAARVPAWCAASTQRIHCRLRIISARSVTVFVADTAHSIDHRSRHVTCSTYVTQDVLLLRVFVHEQVRTRKTAVGISVSHTKKQSTGRVYVRAVLIEISSALRTTITT